MCSYIASSAPYHGRDDARHLLGGYASVAEFQAQNLQHSELSSSAFWVHQRQDAYNALINQRVPKTDLEYCAMDRGVADADEYVWAKRPVCLMAECVEFCFGNPNSIDKHNELERRLEEWYTHKPVTFSPVHCGVRDPANGRMFPEICVVMDYAGKHCLVPLAVHTTLLIVMTSFCIVVLLLLPTPFGRL
jgi:hypothetical protein